MESCLKRKSFRIPAKRTIDLIECVLLGSDMDELHQHVNPVLLPKSLGGCLEEEECDVSQHILKNLAYIRYERSFSLP